MTPRYVRTEGDRRARKAWRSRRKAGTIWVCPGCRTVQTSHRGLSFHLMLDVDVRGHCKALDPGWGHQRAL